MTADEGQATPIPEVEDEFAFEIVDQIDEPKDEATVAYETKIAEQEAMIKQLQEAGSAPPQNEGNQLEELAKLLKAQQAPTQATAPLSVEDQQSKYLEHIEKIRKNWHSDPAGNAIQLMEPLMKAQQDQTNAMLQKQAVQLSKISALQGADSTFMQKYSTEVDSIVETLPPSEMVYQEALGRVKLMHQDEIIQEQVEAKVQAQLDEMQKKLEEMQGGQNVQTKNAPFTLANQQAAPANKFQQQKQQITKLEAEKLQRYVLNHMVNWNNELYRNKLVKDYKEGRIRV